MSKPKVFVSFDYENDRIYKYLLNAWNENTNFEFSFEDRSSPEIQSWNISVVKNVLSRKINEATSVLVIIGKEANKVHADRQYIGYRNWQNYEVAKAKELGKRLIAVQLDSHYEYPEELLTAEAIRVYSFTRDAICRAIENR